MYIDENGITIYENFEEVPPSDQIPDEAEVHLTDHNRTWKWDGSKWTLYSDDSTIGGIKFNTEVPIEHTITTTDGDDISVSHFFDLADLTPLDQA